MANTSLLAAIHNAVVGTAEPVLNEDETGAAAHLPTTKESTMSKDNPPAGGATKAGTVTQADHDAAIASARTEAMAEGAKAATERLSAALGAEGVKGDAGRMTAALDLAVKSPAMSGADVASFVTNNVAASASGKPASATDKYVADRTSAASLAQPQGGGDKAKSTTALASAVAASNKRR